jgi:dTDP-4-dehydrorhamnose reductase
MMWVVTGAGGMLGTDLSDVLHRAGEQVTSLRSSDLDVRDLEACRRQLAGADVVVNCAGWTDVDGAETHEGEAFAVNAVGAANVARASAENGVVMVQISTDYVFDGQSTEPYRVDHPVAPLNAYGRTKAAAEWAVRAECPSSYVVRTAWLYGARGPSFVRTVLRLAEERESIEVVDDQVGQPTWTRDLAAFVRDLVVDRSPYGVHHGTASGQTSWYGFARAVFAETGLDPARVHATTSEHFPRPARRPAYSVLDNGGRLPEWSQALAGAMTAASKG